MLNQRGQAFSVFELLIAGVVAFAILIILLQIMGGLNFNPSGNAKDTITNAIKNAGMSGNATSANFQLAPNDQIVATNLADKTGYDPQSIMFCAGDKISLDSSKIGDKGLKVETLTIGDKPVSKVSWGGLTPLKAKAIVVCEVTNTSEAAIIDSYASNCSGISDYCNDSQPCCAVIIEKQ